MTASGSQVISSNYGLLLRHFYTSIIHQLINNLYEAESHQGSNLSLLLL